MYLVSPHYDDEFIGCHGLLNAYKEEIKSIIYFTDSSLQANKLSMPVWEYALTRHNESMKYGNSIGLNSHFHLLSIPDGLSCQETVEKLFLADSTEDLNNRLVKTLNEIVGDGVIIFPNLGETQHPSHVWCSSICKQLLHSNPRPYVEYYVHQLFNNPLSDKLKSPESLEGNFYTLQHKEGEKQKLFEQYFPSQAFKMKKAGFTLSDREEYYSTIELEKL